MEQEKQVLEQQKINSEKKFDEKMEEMMQAIAGKNEEIIELREAEIERLEDENRKVSAETESLRQENEQLKKENEKCCIQ